VRTQRDAFPRSALLHVPEVAEQALSVDQRGRSG